MKRPRVVVVDDDLSRLEQWLIDVSGSTAGTVEVHAPSAEETIEAVVALTNRQVAARKGQSWRRDDAARLFDDATIFIVDYDLLGLDPRITGESIAYLARCFSDCGVIVAMNQFGENVFDLLMDSRFESFADLNIGSAQLASKALWHWDRGGFRPSSWVPLLREAELAAIRAERMKGHLGDEVLPFLGFSPQLIADMPSSVLSFLSDDVDPRHATFRDLVRVQHGGLHPRDASSAGIPDSQLERIAAARAARWLRDVVVARQDILVTAPHLVSRLPGTLSGLPSSVQSWTATTDMDPRGAIRADRLPEGSIFENIEWTSRRTWVWPMIASDDKLVRALQAASEEPDIIFCEDVSDFMPTSSAREFLSTLDGPYARRSVLAQPDSDRRGVARQYAPAVRFSM